MSNNGPKQNDATESTPPPKSAGSETKQISYVSLEVYRSFIEERDRVCATAPNPFKLDDDIYDDHASRCYSINNSLDLMAVRNTNTPPSPKKKRM